MNMLSLLAPLAIFLAVTFALAAIVFVYFWAGSHLPDIIPARLRPSAHDLTVIPTNPILIIMDVCIGAMLVCLLGPLTFAIAQLSGGLATVAFALGVYGIGAFGFSAIRSATTHWQALPGQVVATATGPFARRGTITSIDGVALSARRAGTFLTFTGEPTLTGYSPRRRRFEFNVRGLNDDDIIRLRDTWEQLLT